MSRLLNWTVALLGILVLLCAHFVVSEHSGRSTPDSPLSYAVMPSSSATGLTPAVMQALAPADAPAPEALPPTLAGLSHEITLQVDAQDRLVTHADNLRLMDFYLAAVDEEPLAVIRQRIASDLRRQLGVHPAALADALALLDRYWSYRTALHWLPPLSDDTSAWALEQQFNHIASVRQQYFTETEREIYFGEQDAQDRFMLDTLAIQQDGALSETSRQQAIDALLARQPDTVRNARNEVTRIADLQEQARQLQRQGAGAEVIYQFRAAALGDNEARALAELDEKQSDWQQRLEAFSQAYTTVITSGVTGDARTLQVDRLLEQYFPADERAHALAYVEFK